MVQDVAKYVKRDGRNGNVKLRTLANKVSNDCWKREWCTDTYKNLVQESSGQRVIIKSYRHSMATAGCFSEYEFIYMIWLWR